MRKVSWAVMTAFALLIATYAVAVLLIPAMRPPFLQDRFRTIPIAAFVHLLAAAVALTVGAFQHNTRIRNRFLGFHRWLGRSYVLSVMLGGLAGLALAPVSQGGLPAHLGFGLLALIWLGTTVVAYRRIRGGNQLAHRRWMTRSYALTFAAVTLRIYLPLSQLLGIPFEPAYQVISWLCWVPNLLFAELLIRRDRSSATPVVQPSSIVAV